jgi:hypothetical protein
LDLNPLDVELKKRLSRLEAEDHEPRHSNSLKRTTR